VPITNNDLLQMIQAFSGKGDDNGPNLPPRRVHRGDIRAETYSDGSGPTFRALRPGTEYGGVNERLTAQDNGESLLINENATSLNYKRDFGFCSMPFLTIHGDMGRAHYPQKWATGLLPIIPLDHFWAWFNGAPRLVLEFRPPHALENHWEDVVYAYIFLLVHGWSYGFVSQVTGVADYWLLLNNLGFTLSQGEIHMILHRLIADGFMEERLGGYYTKHNPALMKSPVQTQAVLAGLFGNFRPFLKVPDLSAYNTRATSPLNVQGGWVRGQYTEDKG